MPIALIAVALAVLVAVFVTWPLLRPREGALGAGGDESREALQAEKLLALRAIRELELDRQAGLLAEDDYADLRARYEARASAILRQLDALPAPAPVAAPKPKAPPHRGPATAPIAGPSSALGAARRVAWTQRPFVLTGGALVLLVFGVVMGVLAMRYLEPAPPDPMAPVPPVATAPGGGEAGGAVRPIPPGMLQGMLQAARTSFDAGRYNEAAAAYRAVLKREPENLDALTHFGAILAIAGHTDQGLEHLGRALSLDPNYREALWYKAGVLDARQDYAGAIAAWEKFAAVSGPGEDRERAQAFIREAKKKMGSQPAGAKG
jgi:cytochrome c-type biogenesis protein CcmH/NrfG